MAENAATAVTLETIAAQMERMIDGMDTLHRATQRLLDRLERIERNVQAIADRLGAVPLDEALDGPAGSRDPRVAAQLERLEERLRLVEQRLRN